ncbi:hypothetical protein CC80DRAFT_597926 [Byssothecium circinans]|uniref:Cryptic loci regulator 2 N-terminal domain-containing protein n=1 Tax=Byssothecium circinans TaxID=147558 RepID=A0A6A5TJ80_9PLEO|nr:hypothetical protein CC80DRAFT_599339 [Byssothecium circinans]KAF1950866.1 hypothetical protein CC80DRAFT_597926 [Byssothecium circinans]
MRMKPRSSGISRVKPLTAFYPIFACKSDGQPVVNQKGNVIRNGPTEEQLNNGPNKQGISDYYRKIEKDDPKHIEWRKKLGGMLLREVGGKAHEDKWNQCILHEFPDGYHLYEHIKSKGKSNPGDRQDAYLYGYPKGPKKRFRSPIEFFPHLLWLSTDETSDYQNCTCRICSPLQLEAEKTAPPPPFKVEPKSETFMRKENTPVGRSPTVQQMPMPMPIRRQSAGTPTAQSPNVKPATPNPNVSTQIRAPERKVPTDLPPIRHEEQGMDARYGKWMARTGEVVWFFRPTKAAWGLGLVARRWTKDNKTHIYLVQPLSHPFDSPAQELVTDQIKPWLAWSAPSCTYAWLQQNPHTTYNSAPWADLLAGRYGDGIPDVDASILAAKAVDITYTLFERIKSNAVGGMEYRQYNGIYLGGEKIWNGEPVRLRLALGTDIMVVTTITEKVAPGSPAKVNFTGDVYSYKTLPVTNPNAPPQPPTNNQIPVRMREDINWRNRILIPNTGTIAYWDLVSVGATIDISEVKGRWYESSILFEDYFKAAVQKGEGGNGIWMNARGDATGQGKFAGTPCDRRLDAFGNAVPKNLQLVDGLEPPPEQPNKTAQPPPPMRAPEPIDLTGETDFTFDTFMNLDGADDAGMPFDLVSDPFNCYPIRARVNILLQPFCKASPPTDILIDKAESFLDLRPSTVASSGSILKPESRLEEAAQAHQLPESASTPHPSSPISSATRPSPVPLSSSPGLKAHVQQSRTGLYSPLPNSE